jgi:hypothetical protein
MAADDFTRYYMGGPRHAPKADVAGPDPIRQNPVGSFSSAPLDPSTLGTAGITNAAARRTRKRGGASGLATPGSPEGPDLGLYGGTQDEIISASGLGQQKSASSDNDKMDSSKAEAMSDRDPDRPPVTPLTSEDAPLLTRIRAKLSPPDYFATE